MSGSKKKSMSVSLNIWEGQKKGTPLGWFLSQSPRPTKMHNFKFLEGKALTTHLGTIQPFQENGLPLHEYSGAEEWWMVVGLCTLLSYQILAAFLFMKNSLCCSKCLIRFQSSKTVDYDKFIFFPSLMVFLWKHWPVRLLIRQFLWDLPLLFCLFLQPHLRHIEILGLNQSCSWGLHHSLWQHQILNWGRDPTHILTETVLGP